MAFYIFRMVTSRMNFYKQYAKKADHINALGVDQANIFAAGDKVIIQSEPFTDYPAIFDARTSGHEYIRVFLQMLQDYHASIELSAAQVKQSEYNLS